MLKEARTPFVQFRTFFRAAIFITASCALTVNAAESPTPSPPAIGETLGEMYAKLVLALGEHDPDYVDAFYGPPEWKVEAARKKWSLDEIETAGGRLRLVVSTAAAPTDEMGQLLGRYIAGQLSSLIARTRFLKGERLKFDEESRAIYDAVAPTFPDSHFAEILDQIGGRIPGDGPLTTRYENWKKPFVIPRDKLDTVFQLAIKECRRRTLEHISLPPGESFTVDYVRDKPWGGYNWYKGDFHSVIQVNTDLPIFIDRAIDLAAHEGYPGHHVYNALLEKNLVRDRGWKEFTVYPLFSPQSLIAEGTANYGRELVFTEDERMKFEKDVLFPAAGIDPARAQEFYAVQTLVKQLDFAPNEAARKLVNGEVNADAAASWLEKYALMDPARARQRVKFIERYRSYVINYNLGEEMVRRYVEQTAERRMTGPKSRSQKESPARWSVFAELLGSPRLPSGLH